MVSLEGNVQQQRAETLLNDYNHYRFQTTNIRNKSAGGAYITSVGATLSSRPKYLDALGAMASWCDGHDVEPRHWLHSLFACRQWMYSPPLKHLTSPKHLKRYQTMGNAPEYRAHIAAEQHAIDDAAGRVFNWGRDISHGAELLKIRYVQRLQSPGRCMSAMAETFGYHPKSQTCMQCPIAAACNAMLQSKVSYDIQAVRRGDMTSQQASTMAAYSGGR